MLGRPPGPVVESLQTAAAGQNPEDLSDLHHGVVVLRGCGIGAENMFQPDPVVFLGIERVLDQMPFPPAAVDHHGHPLGRKIGEVGDVSVKAGCLGSDFAQENDLGLILAQYELLDPAKVL